MAAPDQYNDVAGPHLMTIATVFRNIGGVDKA
jgi:hypothetical protein